MTNLSGFWVTWSHSSYQHTKMVKKKQDTFFNHTFWLIFVVILTKVTLWDSGCMKFQQELWPCPLDWRTMIHWNVVLQFKSFFFCILSPGLESTNTLKCNFHNCLGMPTYVYSKISECDIGNPKIGPGRAVPGRGVFELGPIDTTHVKRHLIKIYTL